MQLCKWNNYFSLLVTQQVLLLTSLAAILATSTLLNEEDGHGEPLITFRPTPSLPKSKFYSNKKGTQVIEISPDNDCHVHQGEDAQWLHKVRRDRMSELNYFQFRLMIGKCRLEAFFKPLENVDWKLNRTEGGDGGESGERPNSHVRFSNQNTDEFQINSTKPNQNSQEEEDEFFYNTTPAPESPVPLIYPGTLWCGRVSAAKRTNDLGIYTETDKCCREHDQCNENMDGKSCKYGICNESDFTRSHCSCDDRFMICLQKDRSSSSFASFKIANLYFNILKPLCYAERHPVKYCKKYRITGECIIFEYDYDHPPVWQFFPSQPYPTVSDAVDKLINSQGPPPNLNGPPIRPNFQANRGGAIRFPEDDEEDENENIDNH